jgi:mRNA interferase RelE/StbE
MSIPHASRSRRPKLLANSEYVFAHSLSDVMLSFVAVIIPPRAYKQLAAMPKSDAKRLLDRLEKIVAEPDGQHLGVVPLTGAKGVYRVRQGDWRAVFSVEGGDVIVDRGAHRREVYR